MENVIAASFRWSQDEFLDAQRLAMRHSQLGRRIYRAMAIAGTVILFSGAVLLHQHTIGLGGFLFTVLFGAFFFAMPLLYRREALKLYASKPDRDMEVTWEISDNGIRSKTELAASENAWAFFQEVLRLREGFLFYPNDRSFHWLPVHAFRDARDVERLAELARSKVKVYRQVS